ncbi:polysaccharide deacetylase family protein [Candidatus Gracilibacteria bacterium]|nr:polysaccharide deacetylase family protein [Candidatus Gracilibacteria bacterium]
MIISSSKLVAGKRKLIIEKNYITNWSIESFPKNPRLLSAKADQTSVALTFDDGPDPVYTPQILDILDQKKVKGVFFVTGENVEKYPDIANQIVSKGHIIANHTYDHPRTYAMSDQEFIAQIQSTQNIIEKVTGVSPKYFRIPYSDSSSIENIEDLRRYKILEKHNLQAAHYDVDSKDWELNDPQKIIDMVLSHDLKNSSQLLFHDGGSDRSSTVKALPAIIDNIHSQGLKIITLDQFTSKTEQTINQEKKSFSQLGFGIQIIGSKIIRYYLNIFLILVFVRYFGLWVLNIITIFLPKK